MGKDVTLVPAEPADAALLANLLELYVHDLSEAFQVAPGEDGRFGYPKLPLYFSKPTRRFPFLIRFGERIAGFAFATRGSPISDDPEMFDVAEFFVLRGYRRLSVGRSAAFLLWGRMPGAWGVRVSEGNRAGVPFWESIIREYTNGAYATTERPGIPHAWRVFTFANTPRARDATPPREGWYMDPIEARELILVAPKGFHPSDWAERLMNFDEVAELGVDLVYTKYLHGDKVLVVRAEILDPSDHLREDRDAVWAQILRFAKENGFSIAVHPELEHEAPELFALAKKALELAKIST